MAAIEAAVQRAQRHLEAGQFEAAKAAVDEAWALAPRHDQLCGLYANVYLAHGIRLSGIAREMRRQEIEARGKPGETFEDSEAVKAVFREVIAAFDRVLAADPNHTKALSLKAQALFRLDRRNRATALAVYDEAMRVLERTVPPGPPLETGRRNLSTARRRIERPCDWCDDTGFCTECGGTGWRTTLGFRRKCDTCLGHGTCKRCGVL